MTDRATTSSAIALLMAVAVALQVWRDDGWQAYEPATPVMWLQAGPAMERAALGYDALVADIYWIRAVVYFGRQRLSDAKDKNYDLLYPLLDLVTTLDPRFNVAYRFGAFFLSENAPDGPDRPDLAIELLKRGIEARPEPLGVPARHRLHLLLELSRLRDGGRVVRARPAICRARRSG